MKRSLKKTLAAALAVLLFVSLACSAGGCAKKKKLKVTGRVTRDIGFVGMSNPISHEEEFGGIYIKITIDDFNDMGFRYGDSVDLSFSNGFIMKDIPYYNGYYTAVGEPLLVAYPGYPFIRAGINNGDDLWEIAGVDETCECDIELNEEGKYIDIQNARDIHYEDDREKFPSDEAFANFRSLTGGRLREGVIFRSASPCDDQHNRAGYVDDLIEKAGVRYIVNLADNEDKIKGYIESEDFKCDYFLSLYEEGNVIPLAMNANYGSEAFRKKAAAGLTAMADNEGPYLVHCTEGKDRTGFICLLLEALAGASYEEIVSDYMITYDNYYEISTEKYKDKYDVIIDKVLVPMIRIIVDDESVELESADMTSYAESYLLSGGMEMEDIERLKGIILE
ncbi:MAG: tyrosine-protein phosphatase [Christensenellaceae bacterium]|nr:tyrosine-protein phosphatase [Christensenellaceae bacterium]